MAAGSLLTQFTATDLFRETPVGYDPKTMSTLYSTNNGTSRGVGLNKFRIASQLYEYYNGMWILPTLVAVGTGLTFKLMITDDGTDSSDLGLVARIEITPFNLSTALSVVDWSLAASMGTATAANVTLGSTTGLPKILSIAIVAANLASLASGNILGIRIRRVGDNAADTCNGRIILLGGEITDT
jgi:hypothetical protein